MYLCGWMCVWMDVCVYGCVCVFVWMDVCVYGCVCVFVWMDVCVDGCVCVFVWMDVCVGLWGCVCGGGGMDGWACVWGWGGWVGVGVKVYQTGAYTTATGCEIEHPLYVIFGILELQERCCLSPERKKERKKEKRKDITWLLTK